MKTSTIMFTVTLILCVVMFTILCSAAHEHSDISSEQVTMEPIKINLLPDDNYITEIKVNDYDIVLGVTLEDIMQTGDIIFASVVINLTTDSQFQLGKVTSNCLGDMSMDGLEINSESSMKMIKNELLNGTYYGTDNNQQTRRGTGFISQFEKVQEKSIDNDYIQQSFRIMMYECACELKTNLFFEYKTLNKLITVNQLIEIHLYIE